MQIFTGKFGKNYKKNSNNQIIIYILYSPEALAPVHIKKGHKKALKAVPCPFGFLFFQFFKVRGLCPGLYLHCDCIFTCSHMPTPPTPAYRPPSYGTYPYKLIVRWVRARILCPAAP